MKVNVKVTVDKKFVSDLKKKQQQALEMTAEAVKTDIITSGVVPKDHGELERSAYVDTKDIKKGVARVTFDTPYARRLYFHPEYNFRTDKNPNAQGKWMESYHAGPKQKFVQDTFMTFLKGLIKK